MRTLFTVGLAFVGLGMASTAFAGEAACMTAADLAWSPATARALAVIDTQGKGCVTGAQIAAYRAAVKQVRAEDKERIAALLKG